MELKNKGGHHFYEEAVMFHFNNGFHGCSIISLWKEQSR